MSLGLDSAVASKYNEEDGTLPIKDASLSIRVHGEGTDYEWMLLNNCKVGFKHGNGDSKDTVFMRYPEEDVKDSTSVQKLHGTDNETKTSMRAFKKGDGVVASTIYLTDASVSTTTCGEGKSVSASSLFDSKVWRKVGDGTSAKFYPWWVKLTYYKVTNPNGWQKDVITASAVTQSDEVLSIHSNEEYKLKTTTDNLEGYTFKGWVVDNIENTSIVTPTKDINAYAKYNVQKWTVNQPSTTNGTANVTPSGEQKYNTNMTLTATAKNGYYVKSINVEGTNVKTSDNALSLSTTFQLKKGKYTYNIAIEQEKYRLVYGTKPNALDSSAIKRSETVLVADASLVYDETLTLEYTPSDDHYVSEYKVKVNNDTETSNGTNIKSGKYKTYYKVPDLTNGDTLTITPVVSAFVYKLVNGTLTKCTVTTLDSATCGTQYDVVVTPSVGHHIVGDATIDMNQTLTNGTADGDGKTYKWTPTLTYNTDGTPNDLVSGTTGIKINASCVADHYPLTITAKGGDNDANKSFKVQRTSDNTIGGTDSKKGEIQNGGNLYYNDNIQLTYTPDTNKYHVKEGPTLSVGGSPVTLSGSDGAKTYTLRDYAHNTSVNASITYTANTYTLNWTNDANGNGSVSVKNGSTPITSGSTISANKTYTITATPTKATHGTETVDIATLTSLTIDGSIISSGDTYTPSGANSGSKNIQAVFSPIMCQITKGTSDNVTIKLSGADSNDKVQKSTTFKFTASAGKGYYLSKFGSTSYKQSDNIDTKTSSDITVWDNMTVGGTTGTYAVVASIKQFNVTPSITYNTNVIDEYKTGNKIQYKVGSGSWTDLQSNGKNFNYNTEVSFQAVGGTYCDVETDATPNKWTITGTKTVTAKFKIKTFSVTLQAKYDASEIYTYSVTNIAYGTSVGSISGAETLSNFEKSSSKIDTAKYEWDGNWSGQVTSSTTFTRTIKLKTFTVKFYQMDGKTLFGTAQTIKYGESANVPSDVEVEGYTFDGWYNVKNEKVDTFTNITSDNVVYAKYTAWTITISDKDGNNVTYTYTGNKVDGKFEYSGTNNNGKAFTYYLTNAVNGTINLLTDRSNLFENVEGTMVCLDTVFKNGPVSYYRYPEADTDTQLGYVNKNDATVTKLVDNESRMK